MQETPGSDGTEVAVKLEVGQATAEDTANGGRRAELVRRKCKDEIVEGVAESMGWRDTICKDQRRLDRWSGGVYSWMGIAAYGRNFGRGALLEELVGLIVHS